MEFETTKGARVAPCFIWLAVMAWGIGLGAKIFDLVVLGSAWGRSPPGSFELLPYGKSFPVDPGLFFQPLSGLILIGALGGLIAGWKSSARVLLIVALSSLAVIWILTPTVFWPMITDLWEIHRGRLAATDAEAEALVRRWFVLDSVRIALIGIGFVGSVKALIRMQAAKKT